MAAPPSAAGPTGASAGVRGRDPRPAWVGARVAPGRRFPGPWDFGAFYVRWADTLYSPFARNRGKSVGIDRMRGVHSVARAFHADRHGHHAC